MSRKNSCQRCRSARCYATRKDTAIRCYFCRLLKGER